MRESRIFKRSGELILEKSDNIYELILYISLVSGLFTVFASNDIVIIALTPVIFNVVRQSKIENVKIILLSQFVIANTLSMATYIGSPTNIIVSQELGIDFVEYLTYMIVPSLISFLSTIFVIFSFVIISKEFNFLNSFEITSTLEDDNSIEATEATNYIWVIIFLMSVLCVALLTVYNMSLLWCAIPLSVVSVTLLRQKNGTPQNKRTPYGIFFFGICFFIIGEAFASTRIIS
jgi:Na+/H+ antiporter NhaD/arsenite permease-like protein